MRSDTPQRLLAAAAVAAAATGVLASSTSGATKKPAPKKLTVGVFDNYYLPATKKIKVGTTVRWHWDVTTIDVHDVALAKAPKGVKKFQSDPLASGQSYTKKLTKPGTYSFICTFHQDMTMKLTVVR